MKLPTTGLLLALLPASLAAQERVLPGTPALAYRVLGAGEPTVVALHGGPGVPHDYLVPEWRRMSRTFRLVFYDQRGCGGSEAAESYRWPDHVRDLDRLIAAPGTGRVVLAGSSWGAVLALAFAHERPDRVRGLVLSGFAGWPGRYSIPGSLPDPLEARLDSVEAGHEVGEPYSEVVVEGTARIPVDSVGPLLTRRIRTTCGEVTEETGASAKALPPFYALSEVAVPVLLLRGTVRGQGEGAWRDRSGQLATILPAASVVTIRGAHEHDPWMSHPEPFFDAVEEFLRSLDRPRSSCDPVGRNSAGSSVDTNPEVDRWHSSWARPLHRVHGVPGSE